MEHTGKERRETDGGRRMEQTVRKGERQKGLLIHIVAPMLLMNASTNKTKKRKIT